MKKAFIISALLLAGCATQQKNMSAGDQGAALTGPERSLVEGYTLLNQGYRKKAIEEFDKAIEQCQEQYGARNKRVYASRGQTETLYYMLLAAADDKPAMAVDSTCADALYLRGYASLDSGQFEIAEEYIERAVSMAPVNARYLSELGHIQHLKRDWKRALELFGQAEEYAAAYSPPEVRELELTRAKRGVGYSLIELGRLDEAEAKFRECLAIDRKDKNALHELEYIKQLRSGKK